MLLGEIDLKDGMGKAWYEKWKMGDDSRIPSKDDGVFTPSFQGVLEENAKLEPELAYELCPHRRT